ncbi:MAG TPA: PQQ-binding-like beta-propeller repeat protein [Acidobacteriota bacterium]|nr:PQQ-binding-like beta-propeller repeat protein [Acidobacteriota bacterium]
MTDEAAVAFDADDGTFLWSHPLQGVPGSCSTNIPSPIVAGQVVIIAGVRHGTEAVAPMRGAEGWTVDSVWRNDEIKPFWSNLVLEGTELFGISGQRKGQLFALDPATGEAAWMTDGRSGGNGAVLAAGDYVLFVMNEGDLHVARRTRPGLELIAEYTVADAAVWAYPIIHDDDLLVKAGDDLMRWSFD